MSTATEMLATTPTVTMTETPTTMTAAAVEAEAEARAEEAARKGPGGKHDNMRTYTPEEAAIVFALVEAHQPRWTHIAKLVSEATKMPRTAASIRNYYKRFCASKAIADRDSASRKLNRCQACGQIKRGHICRPTTAVKFDAPKGAAESPAPAPAAAPIAEATAAAPSEEEIEPMPKRLALAANGEDMPPLAPASLEVLMPLGSPYLDSLSTPAPVSANFLHGLLAPSPFSFTPALPPSAGAASAAFPFSQPTKSPLAVSCVSTLDDDMEMAACEAARESAAESAAEIMDAEATEVEVSRAASSLA